MGTNSIYEKVKDNLKQLELQQMQIHIDDVVKEISNNNLPFIEGLYKLTNYEIEMQETNCSNALIKAAAFPFKKELSEFDFSFQPSIKESEIKDLLTLHFMSKTENIVFLGSSGVGKTHLATTIGIESAKNRYSTYFIKCNELLQQLKRAKSENRLDIRLRHFKKYKLLIIDEVGYLPIDKEDANIFFQLIDMRYELRSTIVTTNINFEDWGTLFKDEVVASAILDRLLHHSHIISISGNSYRLKDHIQTKENCA